MSTVVDTPPTTEPVFRGRSRWTAALLLTTGAALQLAEAVLEPATQDDNAARVAWWTDHPGRIVASQAVGILAVPFLIGGFAVMVLLARRHARRTSAVAAVALTFAMSGLAAVHGFELGARAALVAGSPHTAAAILSGSGLGAAGIVVLAMFLPGTLIGAVALYVALWRSPVAPRIAVLLGVAFVVLDLVANQYVVSHAALLGSAFCLAWAAVTGYDRSGRTASSDAPPA